MLGPAGGNNDVDISLCGLWTAARTAGQAGQADVDRSRCLSNGVLATALAATTQYDGTVWCCQQTIIYLTNLSHSFAPSIEQEDQLE